MGTHPIFESDFDCLTDLIVLGRVHCVLVHLEQVKVHTGHSFNKSLKGGVDLEGSIVYLSILSRSRFTPGTVSTSPSKEALIWNSLKGQAMTLPVVALESPTWSVTMTGVLMEVPTRVLQMMSKSVSRGEAELQTGTRQ